MPANRKPVFLSLLVACLVAYLVFFAIYFVSLERQFYVWDFGGYQRMTATQLGNYESSQLYSVKFALETLDEDYNYLFTLPLLPVMSLIGATHSRTTYIVSLALVYLVPYLIALGLVAHRLVVRQRWVAFWAAIAVGLFSTAAWLPTLRGYPDTGAAFLLLLACWAFLFDRDLKHWWQILLISACLSLAVLFRRHFAYAAIAFLVSMGVFTLYEFAAHWKADHRQASLRLWQTGLRIGAILLVSGLFFLSFGLPFLRLVIANNYQVLYSAWTSLPGQVLANYQAYYGWGLLILALAGLLAGWLTKGADRRAVGFALLFGAVSVIQWITIVRQTNPHYTLHFSWLLMFGVALAIWWLWTQVKGGWRILGLAAIGLFFTINMVFWLKPDALTTDKTMKSIFTRMSEPLIRPDYAEVKEMVTTLHQMIPEDANLYVVDSSGIINYDLFLSAAGELFPGQPFRILLSPQVDSRDIYPLDSFLQADYVVVSNPLQIHLGKDDQGVVSSVYDAFTQGWEASQAFHPLSDRFPLMWGVSTSIYKRDRETTVDEAIRFFSQIQAVVGQRPGGQPDWVFLDHNPAGTIRRSEDAYTFNLVAPAAGAPQSVSLLYLGDLPDQAVISGKARLRPKTCPAAHLEFSLAGADGALQALDRIKIRAGSARPFRQEVDTKEQPYLFLAVTFGASAQEAQECRLVIEGLTVAEAP
jgi:hypothetical protein